MKNSVSLQHQEKQYYRHLRVFVALCERLVAQGAPYGAVLLCHELYRYLYPVEPHADFKHGSDPVGFSLSHIQKLIVLGNTLLEAATPYSDPLRDRRLYPKGPVPLEKRTSDLYSDLWTLFRPRTLTHESRALLAKRLPAQAIRRGIRGKRVLDMGCGSGRYSIALVGVGARRVDDVDVQARAFSVSQTLCRRNSWPVHFVEGNVHHLPFRDGIFDFVFCNGVLHHTSSIPNGLAELHRVLREGGQAFLYLYGAGGFFWRTRQALRPIFRKIPLTYTQEVLRLIGMPPNRFIFCDTWYVPVEQHTTREQLLRLLDQAGFHCAKVVSRIPSDVDKALEEYGAQGRVMWGDGDHRYLLEKKGK